MSARGRLYVSTLVTKRGGRQIGSRYRNMCAIALPDRSSGPYRHLRSDIFKPLKMRLLFWVENYFSSNEEKRISIFEASE
jgi:hypothetical protein